MCKVEPRGKYGGTKIHLDAEECQAFMDFYKDVGLSAYNPTQLKVGTKKTYFYLAHTIGKKITELQIEHPNLLEERTEEEILATLSKEAIESKLKLEAIGKGVDWKKVKVEVLT